MGVPGVVERGSASAKLKCGLVIAGGARKTVPLDRASEHAVLGQQHRPHVLLLEDAPHVADEGARRERLRVRDHHLADEHARSLFARESAVHAAMVRARAARRLASGSMADLAQLFENNRAWAAEMVARDGDFFVDLARHQSPEYLWIGCSDSRVPANQIVGLATGRDLRASQRRERRRAHGSQLPLGAAVRGRHPQRAARDRVRPLRLWRSPRCARRLAARAHRQLAPTCDGRRRSPRRGSRRAPRGRGDSTGCASSTSSRRSLNVCETTIVEDAWARGQPLTMHGLIYGIEDGLLRDLAVSVDSRERRAEISPVAARPGT